MKKNLLKYFSVSKVLFIFFKENVAKIKHHRHASHILSKMVDALVTQIEKLTLSATCPVESELEIFVGIATRQR